MHPIIIIPARMASTRLPGKPLAMIGGAPMIVQMWRRAKASGIADVVVACDGEAVAEAIAKEGGLAILTDPDLPSGSDRVYAALTHIDPGQRYDVVVNLQGDMPTIDPAIISKAVALLENPKVDIATLAAPIDNERDTNDTAVVKVVVSRESSVDSSSSSTNDCRLSTGKALSFSRRPQGSAPYYHHIGLYAYRRAALEKFVSLPPSPLEQKEKLEQLRAMEAGMRIDVAVVDVAPLGVDTPETLELARKDYDQ